MNNYKIEWQIETIAKNALLNESAPVGFDIEGLHFAHWDFNFSDGFCENRWIAMADVEGDKLSDALNSFYHTLGSVVPRVAFISQCYIDFVSQPFLVIKEGADIAYFRNTVKSGDSGLMFREKELAALEKLLRAKSIPDEFYLYWNDAVNTIGYSGKLLLMFAAVDALVKKISRGGNKTPAREALLGKRLTKIFYGTTGSSHLGLRNRLSHGEYLGGGDLEQNYVTLMHQRILRYFNWRVIRKGLLTIDVRNPQRHILPQSSGEVRHFLNSKVEDARLNLKSILQCCEDTGFVDEDKYTYVTGSDCEGY